MDWLTLMLLASCLMLSTVQGADEFEHAPIRYSESTPENPVSRLQVALEAGEVVWTHDPQWGYLPALLNELQIPRSSQMLVFSKTSLQRARITPRTPRAIYFNDTVSVGYCVRGEVLEISVADPQLGAVFYKLRQADDSPPRLVRETENCLVCHANGSQGNLPSQLVRSVYADQQGLPDLSLGSHRVDHTTPLKDRWGGWYVTGTHGSQKHLGNLILTGRNSQLPIPNEQGYNVVDLQPYFNTRQYLTDTSDIVALLVFEHQTHVQNLITKANFATRQAEHYEAELNASLGGPTESRRASTQRRIQSVVNDLVAGLLFQNAVPLSGPIQGTSSFAEDFVQPGPRDSHNRSLRDLDLQSRLFKYPCSFLIDSPAFDGLPPSVQILVSRRLREILTAAEPIPGFEHLTLEDRTAIWEILQETKPGLWPVSP